MNELEELVRAQSAGRAEAYAMSSPHSPPVTYGELVNRLNRWTDALTSSGVSRDTRVGLAMPSGPDLAIATLAVSSCAISAPLGPDSPPSQLRRDCAQLRLDLLLTTEDRVQELRGVGVPVLPAAPEAFAAVSLGGRAVRRPTLPGDVAMLLRTSGTTGEPKRVPLAHSSLCSAALAVQRSLQLSTADRCLNVMPLWHVHGFVAGLLATLVSGGSVFCPPRFSEADFPAWLEQTGATWYTGTPAIHQSVLSATAGDPPPSHRLRFVRSASSTLPARLAADLEERFSVPVIEAYGMTEASHQIASNPLPPSPRKIGSVGVATGVQVAIRDRSGALLDAEHEGEIVLRGDRIFVGYEDDPDPGSTFADGWFRTGDVGWIDQDGYIFITGRSKEMINRGGETIAPREIEEVLLGHPGVADAVVFGMAHPRLGEAVAAAVVPRGDTALTEAELRAFSSGHLALAKVPARFGFVKGIPRTPTGKPRRAELAQTLVPAWESARPDTAGSTATTDLERELTSIWQQLLGLDEVGRAESLAGLGIDSIMITRAANRIEESHGVRVALVDLFVADNVAGQAALVKKLLND